MLDPAAVLSRVSPGDKVSMTVHKAKAEPAGAPSFLANAQAAGRVPGGALPAQMPQMLAVSRPAVPGAVDHRALLLAHLRQRMLTGR